MCNSFIGYRCWITDFYPQFLVFHFLVSLVVWNAYDRESDHTVRYFVSCKVHVGDVLAELATLVIWNCRRRTELSFSERKSSQVPVRRSFQLIWYSETLRYFAKNFYIFDYFYVVIYIENFCEWNFMDEFS